MSQKNGSLRWRPGPGKVCQKNAYDVTHREPQTQIKFFFETRRLPESVEDWNRSLAAGELWPKKSRAS